MSNTDKAAPVSRFAVDDEAIKAAVHNAFGIEMRQALASPTTLTPGEIEQILLNFKANIWESLRGAEAKEQEALADKDARIEKLEADNKKLNGGELAKKDAEIKELRDRLANMGKGEAMHKVAAMTPEEKAKAAEPVVAIDPAPPNQGYTRQVEGEKPLSGHGPQVKGDEVASSVHHKVVGDDGAATAREDAELKKTAGVRSDGTQPGQPPLSAKEASKAKSDESRSHDSKAKSDDRNPTKAGPTWSPKDIPAKKDTK